MILIKRYKHFKKCKSNILVLTFIATFLSPLSAIENREKIIEEIRQNIHRGQYPEALEYIEVLSRENPRENELEIFSISMLFRDETVQPSQ